MRGYSEIESSLRPSARRGLSGWIALVGLSTLLIAVALGGIDR